MNEIKDKIRKKGGITLIALVITIIVLLILAAVTIAAITGENGLLARAASAREEHKKARALEEIRLIISEVQVEKQGEATLPDIAKKIQDSTDTYIMTTSTQTASLTTRDGKGITDISTITNATEEIYVTNTKYEYEVKITKDLQTSISGKNGAPIEDTSVITISASPNKTDDNDTVSSITVDITIDDTVNITSSLVYYAWSQSSSETAQTISTWNPISLTNSGDKQRTGQITSSQSTDGDWYLYVKAIINGKEEIQHFGEYTFQAKPLPTNLVCERVSTSNDNTTATLSVGSNKAFDGWTVSYQIMNGTDVVKAYSAEPSTITAGTTINSVTVTKGDVITVKYSKSGETDVTKTVNADTFDLTLTAAMIEFSPSDKTTDQTWAAIDNVEDALDYLYQHLNAGSAN